jgi:hypothetical protein
MHLEKVILCCNVLLAADAEMKGDIFSVKMDQLG